MKPRSRRNSEVWKPAGSSARIVSLITRGPANPMSAFGSARMMSPSEANEAITPPVVGLVRTAMYRPRAWLSRPIAALVLAICMSATTPSCMRAPPEAQMRTSGRRSSTASSTQRVTFSPTTDPMLAMRKPESITQRTTG